MISELLHGRRKGFLIVPEGKSGSGWRGFSLHLRKAIARGTLAINLPPKLLLGSIIKDSKSFTEAVVQGQRNEPKTHRQAAVENALNQDTRDVVNPLHLMLDSRNSNQIWVLRPRILARAVLGRRMLCSGLSFQMMLKVGCF